MTGIGNRSAISASKIIKITAIRRIAMRKAVKFIFYPTRSVFRKRIAIWKVPRFHPFVLLVTALCRSKWVGNIGGMAVTGENGSTRRKTYHNANVSTTNFTWTGLGSNPSLHGNLEKQINLNYTFGSSPYRAVNTLRLDYKNQSVNAV